MSALPDHLAVRAHGLGKRYRLGASIDRDASLAGVLARAAAAPVRNYRNLRALRRFEEDDANNVLWAIRNVSFELQRGEVLGVVGRNGAGKSTLLKILSRITEPSEGDVVLRGRVSSLIEVGTGFHGDLTGRDNVFLKGTMLGMTRREVAERLDDIVEFAELEQFMETPVKRYSSGMYVRLAFAVAAHLDPDVLIADEVLAVGDAEFQRRSVGQMRSAAEEKGRSVIFVSHDLSVVSSLCTRAIWLEHGELRATGPVQDVLDQYMHSLEHEVSTDLEHRSDRTGTGAIRATSVTVGARGEGVGRVVPAGRPVEIRIFYSSELDRLPGPIDASVTIETLLREKVAVLSTRLVGKGIEDAPTSGVLLCSLEELALNEGDYMCTIRLEVGGRNADTIADTARFRVDPSPFYPTGKHPAAHAGRVLIRHSWDLEAF
jgi:lipopolysaccharide transport system ATP-binding protein